MLDDGMSLRTAAGCTIIHYSVLYRQEHKGGETVKIERRWLNGCIARRGKTLLDRIKFCSE